MENMFIDWLLDQMRDKGWSQADLAHISHLDSGVISNLITGKRNPGIKTCTAIARALRVSPDIVLQAAGILHHRQASLDDAIIGEINEIYERLSTTNQIEALEYFRMKLRIQDERTPRDLPAPDDKRQSKG